MKKNGKPDVRLLHSIFLRNFLSFGLTTDFGLEALNLLIGPNGAGKSNLIEAIALMRATPVSPQAKGDLRDVLRQGGGTAEWIWKGGEVRNAAVALTVKGPTGFIAHLFRFRADSQGFRLEDEVFSKDGEVGQKKRPIYSYRSGHPILETKNKQRELDLKTFDPELSILDVTDKSPL